MVFFVGRLRLDTIGFPCYQRDMQKLICFLITFFAVMGHMFAEEGTLPPPSPLFLTDALCATDGSVWLASEGDGIWRYLPDKKHWEAVNNLPPALASAHFYALAEDGQGRIWAGTDRFGVVVFNGKEWKMYGREEGLPGERVFSIAAREDCVAVAGNDGITVYVDPDKWIGYSTAEGLPDMSGAFLAWNAQGDLWAAFACGGVGVLEKGASSFRAFQAPWEFGDSKKWFPRAGQGNGLPGNFGNAIATVGDSALYACTQGLALCPKSGNARFVRGKGSAEWNKGLPPLPQGVKEPLPGVLLEDYVTAVFPDGQNLWVGFREQGVQCLDLKTLSPQDSSAAKRFNTEKDIRSRWVRRFIKLPNGELYAATYGGGLRYVAQTLPLERKEARRTSAPVACEVKFPVPPSVPDEKALSAMLAKAEQSSSPTRDAFFWYDDWTTRGNWCHRYGRSLAVLCAANSPDDVVFHCSPKLEKPVAKGCIGPRGKRDDALRHWIDSYDNAQNDNVLWNPDAALRTEAEWDDHGEDYPRTFDGPDVWVRLTVPEGVHLVSAYFYNPNGRKSRNGYRDYSVELRRASKEDLPLAEAEKLPVLARTRVFDFAGSGCWKNFVVTAPGEYLLKVGRHGSFNTILNGVFVSRMHATSFSYETPKNGAFPALPNMYVKNPHIPDTVFPVCGTEDMMPELPLQLWSHALYPELLRCVGVSRRAALLAWRAAVADPSSRKPMLDVWKSELRLWSEQGEKEYARQALADWDRVQEEYVYARSAQWRPHSPGVVPLSIEELEFLEDYSVRFSDTTWEQFRPHAANPSPVTVEQLRAELKRQKEEDDANHADKDNEDSDDLEDLDDLDIDDDWTMAPPVSYKSLPEKYSLC